MPTEVACIGSAHWDIVARAALPLSPGADLPGRILRRPGGVALNVALGLGRAGVACEILTVLGRDAEGDALARLAVEAGVNAAFVRRTDAPTGRYVAVDAPDGGLFAAVADCAALDAGAEALADALAARPLPPAVVADGNLEAQTLARLAALPLARLVLVAASPAKAPRLRAAIARGRADVVINRGEAEALLGRPLRDSRIAAAALCAAGAREAVVTDGAAAASRMGPGIAATLPPPAATGGTTGAGDAFAAALIAADLAGLAPDAALAQALGAGAHHLEADP
jgi:pseudouridine kinase